MSDKKPRIFWHKDGYRAEICAQELGASVHVTKSHEEREILIIVVGSVEAFIKQELTEKGFEEVNPKIEEEITV